MVGNDLDLSHAPSDLLGALLVGTGIGDGIADGAVTVAGNARANIVAGRLTEAVAFLTTGVGDASGNVYIAGDLLEGGITAGAVAPGQGRVSGVVEVAGDFLGGSAGAGVELLSTMGGFGFPIPVSTPSDSMTGSVEVFRVRVIPEPSTAGLVAIGLLALAGRSGRVPKAGEERA